MSGQTGDEFGRVSVTPDRGRVGEWGTWTVRFTAGEGGITAGGGIRIALPDRWNQWWRNSARRVQATEPAEPFYVSAHAGRGDVRLRCEVEEQAPFAGDGTDEYVKRSRTDIAGRPSRYTWVVRVTVEAGALGVGDWIDVRFGDRSAGSRGFTPPLWVGSAEQVRAAVDATGRGEFVLLPDQALPLLYAEAGEPVELAVIIPSTTVVDEPAEAMVVALDAHQNPVCRPGLRATIRVVDGKADLPADTVTLDDPEPWGSARLRFTPKASGIIRLRGQSDDGRLFSVSNPSRCSAEAPAERVYWGDLHSHSHYSWDATGAADDHFRYARDVAGLEVYGNADHGESLSPEEWEAVIALNAQHY
ncbi:MAG: hypothetical protein ACRDI2_04940, partial [Chloroflexota bacterium]